MIINNIGGTATGTVRFTAYNKDFSTTTSVLRETTGTQEMNLSDNIEYSIFRYAVYQNAVCNNLTLGFMVLDKTETDRTYTQHQEENYILNIQQEMLTGDYFDLERKKEVHNWNKIELNGTENIKETTGTTKYFVIEKAITNPINDIWNNSKNQLSTHFIVGIAGYANKNCFSFNYTGALNIEIKEEMTIEELKLLLSEQYVKGNPLTFWCKLATPTELDLTESQIEVLEQLNKLRFYEGVNNILTTEDIALLQAIYPVNLKNVNNKMQEEIDEIKELLSTTQTSAMLLDNLEQDLIKEVE